MAKENENVSKETKTEKKEFTVAKYKTNWVDAVFTALENSKKIWEPSEEPQVAHNVSNPDKITKMFGMNNLLALAALEASKSKVNSFVTKNSIDNYNKNYNSHPENEKNTEKRPNKGSKWAGILLFENTRAKYTEEDKEVINGQAKVGDRKFDENGYAEPDFRVGYIMPADKVSVVPMIPALDENGNIKTRTENEYAIDYKGNPITYKSNGEYTVNGKIFSYKAGEQVVLHHAGSVIKVPDWENSHLLKEENIPVVSEINPEVNIPEPKNSHIRQTMINVLAKVMRGMENGHYEGIKKPTNKQFAEAREYYLSDPNKLFNDFRIANTYARGNAEQINRMTQAYNEKIENNTLTEKNTKKHTR